MSRRGRRGYPGAALGLGGFFDLLDANTAHLDCTLTFTEWECARCTKKVDHAHILFAADDGGKGAQFPLLCDSCFLPCLVSMTKPFLDLLSESERGQVLVDLVKEDSTAPATCKMLSPPAAEPTSNGAREPFDEDPVFHDALVEASIPRPDEGFVMRSPDASFATDMAVVTLARQVDILPRDWRLLYIRVERKGLRRTAVVAVRADDGTTCTKEYQRWQVAETMMPGIPWLEQHGFVVSHRTGTLLQAERAAVSETHEPARRHEPEDRPGLDQRQLDSREANHPVRRGSPQRPKQLGEILLRNGLLTQEQLIRAEKVHHETRQSFGRILIDMGLIGETDLVRAFAEKVGLDFVDLSECSIDPAATKLLPKAVARRYCAVPIGWRDNDLLVAVANPYPHELENIRYITHFRYQLVIATMTDIEIAIAKYYSSDSKLEE